MIPTLTGAELEAAKLVAAKLMEPLLEKLAPIAKQYPDIVQVVGEVAVKAVSMKFEAGGSLTDFAEWGRAWEAAASEFASQDVADRWLMMTQVNGPLEPK